MTRILSMLRYWQVQPPVNELVAAFLEYDSSGGDLPFPPGEF